MTQTSSEALLCRLCGTQDGILINIFGVPNNECMGKIEDVVPEVVILQYDSLSKFICHRCVAKVRDFYEFKEICKRTQIVLKSRLPWMSSSEKTAPLREVEPCIKFIGGPLAYPFGLKEPEVEVLTLSDDEDGVQTNASLSMNKSSSSLQPQAARPLGINGTSAPRPKASASRTQPSPSFEAKSTVWNGSAQHAASGMGMAQNPVIPPVGFSDNYQPHISDVNKTPVKKKAPQATTARMGSSVARGRLSLPAHSFRSIVQSSQTVATNQPGHQYSSVTATEQCAAPAAKRPCKQPALESPRKPDSGLLDVKRKAATKNTSISSTVATPPNVAVPHAVSTPPAVATPSRPAESNFSGAAVLPATSVISSHKPNEPNEKNNVPKQNHSVSPVISNNKIRPSPVQQAKPKPRPKSKKKPIELSEADINNIRSKYPEIEAVKVCGNTVIFTCNRCNKMLLSEEAIRDHECLSKNDSDTKDQNENGLILNQSNDSCNASSYVELSSDEDTSNDSERHLCTICSRLFHSASRLQKHLETHS